MAIGGRKSIFDSDLAALIFQNAGISGIGDTTGLVGSASPGNLYISLFQEVPSHFSSIICGYLYNWFAVSDSRGIAPEGWHVPSDVEWAALSTQLGGDLVAGGPLKETGTSHWTSPNTGATNSSGFTAVSSGIRSYSSGEFMTKGLYEFYWSTTSPYAGFEEEAGAALLSYDDAEIVTIEMSRTSSTGGNKKQGGPIRLLRDTDVGWIEGEQIVDYDGNVYDTVQIGSQIWTVQNLAVAHYKDGTPIPNVTGEAAWWALFSGALCAYDNDINNVGVVASQDSDEFELESGNMLVIKETTYTNYARVAVSRTSAGWTITGVDVTNAAKIRFPKCGATGDRIVGFTICKAGVIGVDDAIFYGDFPGPVVITEGYAPVFEIGEFVVG